MKEVIWSGKKEWGNFTEKERRDVILASTWDGLGPFARRSGEKKHEADGKKSWGGYVLYTIIMHGTIQTGRVSHFGETFPITDHASPWRRKEF